MSMLEKARASLPEPSKGPSKSAAAAKPATNKAQTDSASGEKTATSSSSTATSGGNTNKRVKPGSKPAESKASGVL